MGGGGGETFLTRPEWPWDQPILQYDGSVVFLGGKKAGTWPWSPTPSSVEVKERIELYLCSGSGPSWPVLKMNFAFTFNPMVKGMYREVSHRQLRNRFRHCCVRKIFCSRRIQSTTTLLRSIVQSCFEAYTYEARFVLKFSSLHKIFFLEEYHLTKLSFLRLYKICDKLMITDKWCKDKNWGRSTCTKHAPFPLFLPQNAHRLLCYWIRVPTVTGRWFTDWAMAQPQLFVFGNIRTWISLRQWVVGLKL